MSTNQGIFETLPNQAAARLDSPFAVANEPAAEKPAAVASPFTAVTRQDSPFTVVDDAAESKAAEFGKPVRLPERRKVDSPFQVAEPSEGFGFEAPAPTAAASPFEAAPATAPSQSPFSTPPAKSPPAPVQGALAAFTDWQEPAAPASVPQAFAQPVQPTYLEPTPQPFAPPAQVPSAFAAAPQAPPAQAPTFQPKSDDSLSDSFNIRQLELRAIFGVDREMNADEILQRARALPGMRNIARVGPHEMASIDTLKNLLPSLGFGGGALKLYSGSVPLEFIREGPVLLAVQTDGGFAPGVRETLMIVARELGRMG